MKEQVREIYKAANDCYKVVKRESGKAVPGKARALLEEVDSEAIDFTDSLDFPQGNPVEMLSNLTSRVDVQEYNGGHTWQAHFSNGYVLSILSHNSSRGGDDGLFEIALLNPEKQWVTQVLEGDEPDGSTHVIGWLDKEQLIEMAQKVSQLA